MTDQDQIVESPADRAMHEAFKIDEAKVRGHVDRVVRESVEQTLNGLLDAEAQALCNAGRYERSTDRLDTRAGSYPRKLQTKADEVTLKVPRLRSPSRRARAMLADRSRSKIPFSIASAGRTRGWNRWAPRSASTPAAGRSTRGAVR